MNTVSSPPSPTIASEKEPVQADSGASERVCDHPVREKAVEWRCFHCDDVFNDAAAAKQHFGPDTEWQAACIDPLTKDEAERRADQVQMFLELDREREENSRLTNRDYVLSCYERDLAKFFNGAKSVHQAYLVLDAMEGRALAAEEKLTAHSTDPVIANPANLLRSQPEPASEKECGKAVLTDAMKKCAFYDFDGVEMVECKWALWGDILNALSAPPAASLIAKGEGE